MKKCALKGFASQANRQLLAILSRPLNLILYIVLSVVVSSLAAVAPWGDSVTLAAAGTAVIFAFIIPNFSVQTISRDRSRGGHFAALEYGHRRGVVILGYFVTDVVTALVIGFTGVVGYAVARYLVSGGEIALVSTGKLIGFAAAFAVMISGVNVCVSCYSTRRAVCCGFVLAVLLVSAVSAYLFGVAGMLLGALYLGLVGAFGVIMLPVAYLNYRLRALVGA